MPSPRQLTIGFGSCIKNPDSIIWKTIAGKKPNAFLLLGDNIYLDDSDLGDAGKIRALYRRLFDQPGFRELRQATTVYAVWDDHDFGPNNSDSTFFGKAQSKELFDEFFPGGGAVAGLESTVARQVDLDNTKVLLLDNRTFRRSPAGPTPAMFGEAQLRWIEENLRGPSAPVIVLASGSQWLGTGGIEKEAVESLARYPKEQERILQAISRSTAHVLLLSGDRHFGEILATMVNGKQIYEVTSSPLAARTATAEFIGTDPLRRRIAAGEPIFGMVTITSGQKCSISRLEIFDSHGNVAAALTPEC